MACYRKYFCRRRPQDGFTLIELAVVMLIIAILVVVSLAFFGLIATSHASVAYTNLKGAQAAGQTLWAQNNGSYSGISQTQLDAAEPGLTFSNTALTNYGTGVTNPNAISYQVSPNGNNIIFDAEAYSDSACIVLLTISNSLSNFWLDGHLVG